MPVGWEALGRWGDDAVRVEPLTGGIGVNEVWSVRVKDRSAALSREARIKQLTRAEKLKLISKRRKTA